MANKTPQPEDCLEHIHTVLFQSANDAIFLLDPASGFIDCNPKTLEMFACDKNRIIGHQPFEETFSPILQPDGKNSREKAIEKVNSALDGKPQLFEWQHRRCDGTLFHAEVNLNAVNYNGQTYLLGVVRDITPKKKALEALEKTRQDWEESEGKYRSIFHESPIGILHYDARGVIVDGNKKFFDIIGSPREKLIGLNMINQLKDTKLIEQVTQSLTQGKGYYEDYYTAVTSGKTTPVRILFKGMRNDHGEVTGGVGLIEDITEKAQLEEQLRQSQKMEAIGRLAGGVAHDFNNLLSIINGYCEMILSQIDRDGPLFKKFSQIMKAGEQAASLTRQLLAFSRKQVLKPEIIHVNDLIGATENMLRRLIGEDIELEVRYGAKADRIKADPGQLEQVLMNLSVNARDAMPDGGRLTIDTRNVCIGDDHEKKHTDSPAGDYVVVGISDTGAGMDKDTLQHIFDPFYTTKDIGKGTGLGLSTVYGIIKQTGGTIQVYSEPGLGTTFKIYLPTVAEKTPEEKPPVFSIDSVAGSETILVVEDDETVRDMTIQLLEEMGYTALGAPNGQAALELIAGHTGPIHLMLTDVIMPQMNGRELAEKVSHIYPDIRVIYMSGYTDNAIVHHGVLDAGMDFLQKPVMIRDLAETVRSVLDRPSYRRTGNSNEQ